VFLVKTNIRLTLSPKINLNCEKLNLLPPVDLINNFKNITYSCTEVLKTGLCPGMEIYSASQ
jgi:hypothetical protein